MEKQDRNNSGKMDYDNSEALFQDIFQDEDEIFRDIVKSIFNDPPQPEETGSPLEDAVLPQAPTVTDDTMVYHFDAPAAKAVSETQTAVREPEQNETQDTEQDSGEYRTFDGSREYRSFDTTLPDASPEEWYHFSDEDAEPEYDEDGYYEDDYYEDDYYEDAPKKEGRGLKIFANVLLGFIAALSLFYLVVIYSPIPVTVYLRNAYIQTAMSTLNHKWLATAIVPSDIIADVMRAHYESEMAMLGVETNWGSVEVQDVPTFETNDDPEDTEPQAPAQPLSPTETDGDEIVYQSADEETFFNLFWELDYYSMQNYLSANPGVLADGWAGIDINESGLDEDGTSIKTINGDQVLAINAKEGVILIRIRLSTSRGILAICKDTSRLSLCKASSLGSYGQYAGYIADSNNGILAISGSAFLDPNGQGNGGTLSGLAVCSGTTYGERLGGTNKRIELRNDNKMYIVDSSSQVGSGTRDACEFGPAMIVDGEIVVARNDWNGPHPRAALGQTNRLETMMIIMEGRLVDSPGPTVYNVAEVLYEYNCVQAMNLDGGSTAIMYYKGQYITRCSNNNTSGRTLPTAWIYHYSN